MQFLNVDLVVESRGDLSVLVEEFGEEVHVLYYGVMRGLNHLVVESISGSGGDVDELVNRLCRLVTDLPDEARGVWDACCTRVLDIGYDADGPTETLRSEIRSETIQHVATIGASIIITVYPPNLSVVTAETQ